VTAVKNRTRLSLEIHEQPEVVARLVTREAARVFRLTRALTDREFVLIVARGTSDNAARFAQYAFGITAGLPVALAAPSITTLYGARLRLSKALVIGISQSGRSPDVVERFRRGAGRAPRRLPS
jgi:glucosamine--fructose-6-phosphate aminotransferase (isomerizing)